MAKSANVISIPKSPKGAFNKQRPVSDLLWEQVEHLAAVVRRQIDDERRAIRTEGQASDFIRKMTPILRNMPAIRRPLTRSQKGHPQNTANMENVIRIPKPPANAFNKNRPVSQILWEQVEDLAAVMRSRIENERRAINTEGQASDFIRQMTAILHPDGARKTL